MQFGTSRQEVVITFTLMFVGAAAGWLFAHGTGREIPGLLTGGALGALFGALVGELFMELEYSHFRSLALGGLIGGVGIGGFFALRLPANQMGGAILAAFTGAVAGAIVASAGVWLRQNGPLLWQAFLDTTATLDTDTPVLNRFRLIVALSSSGALLAAISGLLQRANGVLVVVLTAAGLLLGFVNGYGGARTVRGATLGIPVGTLLGVLGGLLGVGTSFVATLISGLTLGLLLGGIGGLMLPIGGEVSRE